MMPKFRVWDKNNKCMHEVRSIWIGDDFPLNSHVTYSLDNTVEVIFDDIELMQSTGLKDKNGVEIFEGDILHRKVHVILLGTDLNKWVDEYVHVEWKYGGWHVGEDLLEFVLEEGIDRHTGCTQTALEVLGNIYENPELLEVK